MSVCLHIHRYASLCCVLLGLRIRRRLEWAPTPQLKGSHVHLVGSIVSHIFLLVWLALIIPSRLQETNIHKIAWQCKSKGIAPRTWQLIVQAGPIGFISRYMFARCVYMPSTSTLRWMHWCVPWLFAYVAFAHNCMLCDMFRVSFMLYMRRWSYGY